MNDDLEQQLARTLDDRAADPTYRAPDLSGFPRARAAARKRRRNVLITGTLATAVALTIAAAGLSRDSATDFVTDTPTASPPSSPSSSAPTTPSDSPSAGETADGRPTRAPSAPGGAKIVRCSDMVLPQRGVGEADITLDTPGRTFTIHFGDMREGEYVNVSYTVAYADDPSCWQIPAVKRLIDRVNPPNWPPAGS